MYKSAPKKKPWPLIERRLRLAAQADFAMAFYNPRSRSRPEGFGRALAILRAECGEDRLILFARAVSTPEDMLCVVPLSRATPEDRKSTRLKSSHKCAPRMPSSA